MSLEYIRETYDVPAKKGGKVTYKDKPGVIIGHSGPHVKIRLEGEKGGRPYHPRDKDLKYLEREEIPVGDCFPEGEALDCIHQQLAQERKGETLNITSSVLKHLE